MQAQQRNVVLNDALIATEEAPSETMRCMQDEFSTLVIEAGWSKQDIEGFGYVLKDAGSTATKSTSSHELARHRFHSLVDDMGALLQRTSISTNIRERLDFSCALLDANGTLIASAPHIPVHLGALGVCVRETLRCMEHGAESMETEAPRSTLHAPSFPRPGDTWITNHPAYGGSHLPDVTLITPVFDHAKALLGFVANRAHHAEIGGMTPGSMPANATCLAQEGVVIAPRYLVRAGEPMFDDVAALLQAPPYPTRNLADNLADLHAQLAANRLGVQRLRELASEFDVGSAMQAILDQSAQAMQRRLASVPDASATETLDDGSAICVQLRSSNEREPGTENRELTIDFTGTSPTHPRNLNATNAIVNSAVLYVLRLLLQEDLPLNEGLLRPVRIVLPEGTLLRPHFTGDAVRDPAVVGGNVEVSQRLVDTLIKALQLQACSQGTMNNLLFGNERFGYYETIAGGAGAGDGYAGASALHTHMTNTAITDPEILEQRYPVRLHQFAIRRGSGGEGCWRGGDGVVREFEFLAPLTVSLLTQHRANGPFGLQGGSDGCAGLQRLMRADREEVLPSSASIQVNAGDVLCMETPGGGGFGKTS
jgi:5-oxoprolinase (ATP-hydrolysing)